MSWLRFARALVMLVAVTLLLDCGGRVMPDTPDPTPSVTEAGMDAMESGVDVALCLRAPSTRSGLCAASAKECGTSDGLACGSCSADEECVADRCYDTIGLPPATKADLHRSLYGDGEGTECTVDVEGDLERVDAPLFVDHGITAIVMDVYAECEGTLALVTEKRLDASEFPSWSDTPTPPTWVLDPPVALAAGTKVRVLFHAEGSNYTIGGGAGERAANESIVMRNVDPACRFFSESWLGLPGGEPAHDWDYVAQLYIHAR